MQESLQLLRKFAKDVAHVNERLSHIVGGDSFVPSIHLPRLGDIVVA